MNNEIKKICAVLFAIVWSCDCQPSYKYSCPDTYFPEESLIFVRGFEHAQSCRWDFVVRHGQHIRAFFSASLERCSATKNFVKVLDNGTEVTSLCSEDKIFSSRTNKLSIVYTTDGQYELIVSLYTNRIYTLYTEPTTWLNASDICKQDGGYLALTYPIVPKLIHDRVISHAPAEGGRLLHYFTSVLDDVGTEFERKKDFFTKGRHVIGLLTSDASNLTKTQVWIGKRLTPWVWFRGCVRVTIKPWDTRRYTDSKYSQMSECASVCWPSPGFLLQGRSCYCISSNVTEDEYVPLSDCDIPCPGQQEERCGGQGAFTFYQLYSGGLNLSGTNDNNHCIIETGTEYHADPCDNPYGFTCRFLNGTNSYITFNKNIPQHNKSLPWRQAVEFCSRLTGSAGLAPIPRQPKPYFQEPYWTGLMRSVVGDFPTVTSYEPDISYVAGTAASLYHETLLSTHKKRPFFCQIDPVTCGEPQSGDSGNFTSPGFPENYQPRLHCQWPINASDGHVIQFTFHTLDIESNEHCLYDFVKVSEPHIRHETVLCNHISHPLTVTTNSNNVTVMFKTDDTVSGRGFRVTWLAVLPSVKTPESRSTSLKLKGGAIAGITVAVMFAILLLIGVVICLVHRKRLATKQTSKAESSMANNALYGMSSFADDSDFSAGASGYENAAARCDLKRDASYANDPSKRVDVKNEYEDLTDPKNPGPSSCDNASKSNLLLSDDECGENKTTNVVDICGLPNTSPVSKAGDTRMTSSNDKIMTINDVNALGDDVIHIEQEEPSSVAGFASTEYESCAAESNKGIKTRPNVDEPGYINNSREDVNGFSSKSKDGKPFHAYLELKESSVSVASSQHYEEMGSIHASPSVRTAYENEYTDIDKL